MGTLGKQVFFVLLAVTVFAITAMFGGSLLAGAVILLWVMLPIVSALDEIKFEKIIAAQQTQIDDLRRELEEVKGKIQTEPQS